ncbi:unnamed protein product [Rotaria socialis]|uniref:Uncharacterized protein n=1 Tax=Rotaria socialis TaxID=392032 RepID=A0A820VU10_9BILA|nr:unnamed protein product [Rotaria socialis]CAF4505162.1 unnamed protein product [Rotaria socialis]
MSQANEIMMDLRCAVDQINEDPGNVDLPREQKALLNMLSKDIDQRLNQQNVNSDTQMYTVTGSEEQEQ